MEPPKHPVGPLTATDPVNAAQRAPLIAQIEESPALLRQALKGLGEEQISTKYKNWTVRQIVNHLADSHVNSYVRFKWALTEENPAIKTYDEGLWSELPDAKTGELESSLRMLEGVHGRWGRLLKAMSDADYAKTFVRPDGNVWTLAHALNIYAWHGLHHTGQILWMREQKRWGS